VFENVLETRLETSLDRTRFARSRETQIRILRGAPAEAGAFGSQKGSVARIAER